MVYERLQSYNVVSQKEHDTKVNKNFNEELFFFVSSIFVTFSFIYLFIFYLYKKIKSRAYLLYNKKKKNYSEKHFAPLINFFQFLLFLLFEKKIYLRKKNFHVTGLKS